MPAKDKSKEGREGELEILWELCSEGRSLVYIVYKACMTEYYVPVLQVDAKILLRLGTDQ